MHALVVEAHGLSSCISRVLEHSFNSCDAMVWLLHGMWDPSRPGIKPMCSAGRQILYLWATSQAPCLVLNRRGESMFSTHNFKDLNWKLNISVFQVFSSIYILYSDICFSFSTWMKILSLWIKWLFLDLFLIWELKISSNKFNLLYWYTNVFWEEMWPMLLNIIEYNKLKWLVSG